MSEVIVVVVVLYQQTLPYTHYTLLHYNILIVGIIPGTALYVYASWSVAELSRSGGGGNITATNTTDTTTHDLKDVLTYGVGTLLTYLLHTFSSIYSLQQLTQLKSCVYCC